MILARNISFSYGYEPIFEGMSFRIPNGSKTALVGKNGAGKTTLLKLLTQEEEPTNGTLEITGTLSHVPQEVKRDPLLSKAHSIEEYVDPTHNHSTHEIDHILAGLGFESTLTDLAKLSGGQKTKLALARAFLAHPDILLLDEPTNFLDDRGTQWVMQFLATYPSTVIVVSHDITLLDAHITQVLYLNTQQHTINTYTGNYSAFLKTKAQQDELLVRQIHNEQQKVKRLEQSVSKLRRLTSEKGVHQRIMLERRIERIKDVLPDAPEELKTIKAKFPEPLRVGEVPLRAAHLYKSFDGKPVLQDVSLEIKRNERVALIGPNGVGKSTLIRILTGQMEADAGTVIANPSLSYGYYSQEFETFRDDETLLDAITRVSELPPTKVYSVLKRFLFPTSRLHQRIGTLSGGEKTRLSIAQIMLKQHNLLILDEPTTYLDVFSQRVILEALKEYKGALLLVSHTEQFVKELRPHRVLLLPQNATKIWSDDLLTQVSRI